MTKAIDFGPTKLGRLRQLTEMLDVDESETNLFFKMAPDLFCIVDNDCYLRKINQAWTNTLGWSEEQLLSKPFTDYLHIDDVGPTLEIMASMQGQDVIRFHNRFARKPGTINRTDYSNGQPAGEAEFVVLEWDATNWKGDLIYAVARQVPASCLLCPDAQDRFKWSHRNGKANGAKKTK
jgi:PAS domain S-box-containing protein